MELYGEVVKHKVFGRGQIVEFANNYVTVLFDENKSEKKFTYPTAFELFLELENKSFLKQIEEDKNVIAQKEAESKRINEEICKFYEETKSEFSKSVCYESQMLEIWNAGAGITQNGDEKGKPMSLRNVKANSLSLLTSKLPYAEDKERFIFAVFLIDENYEGDNRSSHGN